MAIKDSWEIQRQKFLALEGLKQWVENVQEQSQQLSQYKELMQKALMLKVNDPDYNFDSFKYRFRGAEQFFLIAAHQMFLHRRWATKLGMTPNKIFSEIDPFERVVDELRDMREHIIEYFKGGGRKKEKWEHKDESGSCDASSTVGTLIGGRLDWVELGKCAASLSQILSGIPTAYPKPEMSIES